MPPRSPAHLMHAVGLAALAVTIAACGLTAVQGPRSWTVATSDSDGHESTINVSDRSGKVSDIEFGTLDANHGPGVVAVPGKPNALDVSWVGGECDDSTTIDIAAAGPGLAITVKAVPEAGPCDAIGVTRSIRLNLTQPIPPGLVAVSR